MGISARIRDKKLGIVAFNSSFIILTFYIIIIGPGYLRHTDRLLPLLPSGPDGVCSLSVAQGLVFFNKWRRERDLNPRNAFWHVHTISSRAPSASRTSLRRPSLYHTFSVPLKDNKNSFKPSKRPKRFRTKPVHCSLFTVHYPPSFVTIQKPWTFCLFQNRT